MEPLGGDMTDDVAMIERVAQPFEKQSTFNL
jgi:hypothetical protein